ncbi:syntaxin of plants 81 [Actinidia rufa]|uniref:Syntaxin of plants 81 n=1 Tax=Actinidia rufa TaxID=165716 RepID=A0A7J0ECF1_9ERIC|nr:syntaxin of plants 81 [Actinidia rufa]
MPVRRDFPDQRGEKGSMVILWEVYILHVSFPHFLGVEFILLGFGLAELYGNNAYTLSGVVYQKTPLCYRLSGVGRVLILSERLHLVTSQFDQLRAIRFQEAINRATPRRKLKRVAASNSMDNSNANDLELKKLDNSEHREPDEVQTGPFRVQQQLLDDETRALQVELTSLLDAVQETETKMVEMSALNHLMSTHVLQQAQQIELLYDQTLIFLPFYCGVMLMLNIFKALLTSIKHS